jgi:hypothetical protein
MSTVIVQDGVVHEVYGEDGRYLSTRWTVGGSVARRSLASYLVQTYGRAGDAAVEVIFMRVETPVPAVSGGPCGPVVERMVEAVPVEPAHGAAVSAR